MESKASRLSFQLLCPPKQLNLMTVDYVKKIQV